MEREVHFWVKILAFKHKPLSMILAFRITK